MATKTRTKDLSDLEKLIRPFGWSIDQKAAVKYSATSLQTIVDWCRDDSTEQDPCPGSLWKLVDVPYERRKAFSNENDVRALLFNLLSYRADFADLQADPTAWVSILVDNINQNQGSSPFGTLYIDDDPDDVKQLAIWFGKKAGQLPALSGDNLKQAILLLLVPSAAPHEQKPETPPPAASISGHRSKGQPKMVAKKAKPDAATATTLEIVPLSTILADPKNHRKHFDKTALEELSASIKQHGVLQPLLLQLRADADYPYKIIAGERRYRAAIAAGLTHVPAQIVERDGLNGSLAMLEENIRREDLSPIERAQAIAALIETHGLTQAEVGAMIGCTQAQISNELRLLNIPEKLQGKIGDAEGQIAATTIRPALPYMDIPAVVDGIEQMLKQTGPITGRDVQIVLDASIRKAGRSMYFLKHASNYVKPQKTVRHFETVSAADRKELQIRKYDNEEYAFNVTKFDELNAEPLEKRIKAHKKATALSTSSTKTAKAKDGPKYFENSYRVQQVVEGELMAMLATALEKCKDKSKAFRVSMVVSELADQIIERQDYKNAVRDILAAYTGSAAEIQETLRKECVRCLREDLISLDANETRSLAEVLGVDLISQWSVSDDLMQALNDAGRAAIASTEEGIPEFLEPFFCIEPIAKAGTLFATLSKSKKSKAA